MISMEDVIQNISATKTRASEQELRQLPYKEAFIYGRVSSTGQVQESRESIRDIGKLLVLAIQDGYSTGLDPVEIERWLQDIQDGVSTSRALEDGEVIISCEDLGLSGSLGEDKRPGLSRLRQGVQRGEVGAVYLTEGMSRLSRDRDRILGYQLLKLLKDQNCRVRTTEGIFNPAIPRDWENLAEDVADSASEMKKMGLRLGRRRDLKAAEGKHIGSVVSPGFIVPIEGHKRDGSYIFNKWEAYPPHQEVVITVLKELVRQRSPTKVVQRLRSEGVVFPFFPDELRYMESRTALRSCATNDRGYLIRSDLVRGLGVNVKLIGIWDLGGKVIENNHPAIVPRELFLQAYEVVRSKKKPRGRAIYHEPMDWADLIWCYNHEIPQKLRANNSENIWGCVRDYEVGDGTRCLYISDHILTKPLTREFLRSLDLSPHAQEILERMQRDVGERNLEEARRKRQERELKTRIANLETCLGSGDPEREETYWRLIKEARAQMLDLQVKPIPMEVTALDIEQVRHFLENLEGEWESYSRTSRNRLLHLLVERVELRHNGCHMEGIIIWKTGFRQLIKMERPESNYNQGKNWKPEEVTLLRMLWPSSSREVVVKAIPDRNWNAMSEKARLLGLKRARKPQAIERREPWTKEQINRLKELYLAGVPATDIAQELKRTPGATKARACKLKLKRPREFCWRKKQPGWTCETLKLIHGERFRQGL